MFSEMSGLWSTGTSHLLPLYWLRFKSASMKQQIPFIVSTAGFHECCMLQQCYILWAQDSGPPRLGVTKLLLVGQMGLPIPHIVVHPCLPKGGVPVSSSNTHNSIIWTHTWGISSNLVPLAARQAPWGKRWISFFWEIRFPNHGFKTGSFAVTRRTTLIVASVLLIFPCVSSARESCLDYAWPVDVHMLFVWTYYRRKFPFRSLVAVLGLLQTVE